MTPKLRTFLFVGLSLLAADWATKALAVRALWPSHTPRRVVGDLVRLTLAFNRHGAMGIVHGSWSRPALAAVAVCGLAVLGVVLRHTAPTDRLRAAAVGLLAAGAAGNLWDRVRWGRGVVDFVDVGVGALRFWTFNVADASLTVGAVLLAVALRRADSATTRT